MCGRDGSLSWKLPAMLCLGIGLLSGCQLPHLTKHSKGEHCLHHGEADVPIPLSQARISGLGVRPHLLPIPSDGLTIGTALEESFDFEAFRATLPVALNYDELAVELHRGPSRFVLPIRYAEYSEATHILLAPDDWVRVRRWEDVFAEVQTQAPSVRQAVFTVRGLASRVGDFQTVDGTTTFSSWQSAIGGVETENTDAATLMVVSRDVPHPDLGRLNYQLMLPLNAGGALELPTTGFSQELLALREHAIQDGDVLDFVHSVHIPLIRQGILLPAAQRRIDRQIAVEKERISVRRQIREVEGSKLEASIRKTMRPLQEMSKRATGALSLF